MAWASATASPSTGATMAASSASPIPIGLEDCLGEAFDVSFDGSIVCGEYNDGTWATKPSQAFIFTEADGITLLGTVEGIENHESSASAISEDGKIVGMSSEGGPWGFQQAFIEFPGKPMQYLWGLPHRHRRGHSAPASTPIYVLDLSGDGSLLVGVSPRATSGTRACSWSASRTSSRTRTTTRRRARPCRRPWPRAELPQPVQPPDQHRLRTASRRAGAPGHLRRGGPPGAHAGRREAAARVSTRSSGMAPTTPATACRRAPTSTELQAESFVRARVPSKTLLK